MHHILLLIILLYSCIGIGGTIDPNTQDKKYVQYASEFDCVVKISGKYNDGKAYSASAVIIHPNWILTAAHVVNNSSFCEVEIRDKKFFISYVIIYKDFTHDIFGKYDIAMGYSKENFNLDFYPELYTEHNEKQKVCSIVGYGFTGNFNTGAILHDGKKRAGSNIIDDIMHEMLVCSATKSSTRTSLELLIASGDSGGGLFIDGKLAGINSCVMSTDASPNSDWDDETGHTRVSLYKEWILRNINEKKK